METCYEVELRIKRMFTPDTSGAGPFSRADDLEAGMKILLYPQIINNSEAMALVIRSIKDATEKYYGEHPQQKID